MDCESREFQIGILPHFLRFNSADDLVRLGKSNDGGYLVSRRDVQNTNHLIGLGLGYDWSFERDFIELIEVPVSVFDGSVRVRNFFRNGYADLAKLNLWGLLFNIYTAIRYLWFFRGSRVHRPVFIGASSSSGILSLTELFSDLGAGRYFIKIDIEGNEYRLLSLLLEHQSVLSGCVIEFHDCDLHLDKIERFVSRFPLKVVHIHANNYAEVDPVTKLPRVLELTFSRHGLCRAEAELPHHLDMPNNKRAKEIGLSFAFC